MNASREDSIFEANESVHRRHPTSINNIPPQMLTTSSIHCQQDFNENDSILEQDWLHQPSTTNAANVNATNVTTGAEVVNSGDATFIKHNLN